MNQYSYQVIASLILAIIMGAVAIRIAQARSIKKVPIDEDEFRVVYSTDKKGFGLNLGIVRIRNGELVLYDRNRRELLRQVASDARAELFLARGYLWVIESVSRTLPNWKIAMAATFGWEIKDGISQNILFSEALKREGILVVGAEAREVQVSAKRRRPLVIVLLILAAMLFIIDLFMSH